MTEQSAPDPRLVEITVHPVGESDEFYYSEEPAGIQLLIPEKLWSEFFPDGEIDEFGIAVGPDGCVSREAVLELLRLVRPAPDTG